MHTLKYLSKVYITHFKLDMAVRFQYRVDTIFYSLTVILLPVIYLSVWSTAAGSDQIGGYTQSGFAAYYIAVLVTNHFTDTWTMWLYEGYVRSGSFVHELLRPLHPVHVEIAPNVTHKIFSLLFLIPTIGILIVLFQPEFDLNALSLVAFFAALILAMILAFLLGWAVALIAFWSTRMDAINQIYFLLMLFFSGQFAPLTVLPSWLASLAAWLPFRWIISFPVEILLGNLTGQAAGYGMIIQLGWIVALLAITNGLWSIGVRRFSAVGG